jgi:hypothetical protein
VKFQLVFANLMAGERKKAQDQARELLRMDRATRLPSRRLTHPQREQIQHLLEAPASQ